MWKPLLAIGLAAPLGVACQSGPPSNPAGTVVPIATNGAAETGEVNTPVSVASAAKPAPGQDTVQQALTASAGTEVAIAGLYFGWNGPCKGVPPTRSAWQIADQATPGGACLYVDGPSPRGVNPVARPSTPPRVKVRGVVRESAGERYLEAKEASLE